MPGLVILTSAATAGDTVTPVLLGAADSELAPHGGGNIYAPEVHRVGARLLLWYGGQGSDGHDRIHLAESNDGKAWTKRGVVLDCGKANHVNDPSVVRVDDVWWMFYTVAETAEDDEIARKKVSDEWDVPDSQDDDDFEFEDALSDDELEFDFDDEED